MPYQVAAFYQFAALPDFRELQAPLREICAELELKGSVLLAEEGINGTLAGAADAIGHFIAELGGAALFGGRFDNLKLKFSQASAMPFRRLKMRLKKEMTPSAHPDWIRHGRSASTSGRPAERAGRDAGHAGARHPQRIRGCDGHLRGRSRPWHRQLWSVQGFCCASSRSGQASEDRDVLHRRHSLQKASAYLLARGFAEVYHLKGGILGYLEGVPEARALARRMFRVR